MSEVLPPPVGPRIRDTSITSRDVVVLEGGTRLIRAHLLAGTHPASWDTFRRFGPTRSRFDHHQPPPRAHGTRSIAYVTYGDGGPRSNPFTAVLAELFQDDGGGVMPFDLTRDAPHVSVFEITRRLRLLDLASGWVTRAGGNQAISSEARSTARAWARLIYLHHHSSIDGVAYHSSVWPPGRCAALWQGARSAFPVEPLKSDALDAAGLRIAVAHAAEELRTSFTV